MPVPLLPHLASTYTLVTEAVVHGDGWHVKDLRLAREYGAAELLAVHPVARVTAHDTESAVLVIPMVFWSHPALAMCTMLVPKWS